MNGYLMYILAICFLGLAVRKMVNDAEDHAYEVSENEIRDAWSNGFERGVKSAS